jgi:hypothetical protein
MDFMRLSSMKAACAAVAWCLVQEIRVKPHFGLSGIPALDVQLRDFGRSWHPWVRN